MAGFLGMLGLGVGHRAGGFCMVGCRLGLHLPRVGGMVGGVVPMPGLGMGVMAVPLDAGAFMAGVIAAMPLLAMVAMANGTMDLALVVVMAMRVAMADRMPLGMAVGMDMAGPMPATVVVAARAVACPGGMAEMGAVAAFVRASAVEKVGRGLRRGVGDHIQGWGVAFALPVAPVQPILHIAHPVTVIRGLLFFVLLVIILGGQLQPLRRGTTCLYHFGLGITQAKQAKQEHKGNQQAG